MRFGLSEELAQSIVDRAMSVIPYNINVMNSEGFIIASGDKDRINLLHQGALKAIHENGMYMVTRETATDKLGVNMPIYYANEIIGVIGISGDPQQVKHLVFAIKVIAELMIERQYMLDQKATQRLNRENFLREWCDSPDAALSESFKAKGERLGIKVGIMRTAVMLHVNKPRNAFIESFNSCLQPDEYVLRYRSDVLALLKDSSLLGKRLQSVLETFPEVGGIGVGGVLSNMAESVRNAQKCLNLLKKQRSDYICQNRILFYDAYYIFEMVDTYPKHEKLSRIFQSVEEYAGGDELEKTIITYFRLNGNIKSITDELHIHRNTLLYRLQKIHDITGKSFQNIDDLFTFYVAYLLNILKGDQ
jgi:carbohydrate diacid regulator